MKGGKQGQTFFVKRDDFSAKLARGGRRRELMEALLKGPSRPVDLAQATGMRAVHVSRTLRELVAMACVECHNPGDSSGRFYGLTPEGLAALTISLGVNAKAVPLVRGSHMRHVVDYLCEEREEERVKRLLRGLGLEAPISYDGWYPLSLAVDFLGAVEEEFGDGSSRFIAHVAAEIVPRFSFVRAMTGSPSFRELWAMAPSIYLQEFNHGRLEVKVGVDWAEIIVYHWLTSFARCAAWVGTIRGLLRVTGFHGTVEEITCSTVSGEACRYLVRVATGTVHP